MAGLIGAGVFALTLLGGGATAVAGYGHGHGHGHGHGGPPFTQASIPPGFSQMLLLIANGEIPDTDSPYLDGNIFQVLIMGRTPAEIAQRRALAAQFFEDRFGVVDAENNPDVDFQGIYVDPRLNYRAYLLGGDKVRRKGWVVHDGGFVITVTNPGGITLGGEYAGLHVPPGTVMGMGEYSIQRTTLNGRPLPPMIIEWSSIPPALPNPIGTFGVVNCTAASDEFGIGVAEGLAGFTPVGNGMINANFRNVITFSDDGGL